MRLLLLAVLLWVGVQQQQQGLLVAGSVLQSAAVVAAATAVQEPSLHAPSSTQQQQQVSAAAVAADAAGVLPGDPDPAGDAMVEWLNSNGGQVNVAIRRNVPGAGRSTFAPRAFKKGDVLASIPVEMTYVLADTDESLAVSSTYLMADMAEEDSPWAPYFNSLPGPDDVWSTADVPKSYFPIIQDENVELAISLMHDNVDALWESYEAKYKKVLGPNVSPRNITYGMGVLLTRLFRFEKSDVLLPIVDMANHDNLCLHSHLPEPCDPKEGYKQWKLGKTPPPLSKTVGSGVYGPRASSGSSEEDSDVEGGVSGQCIVWRAEEDVAAGQEVCNYYKTLKQDRALLQYGFLQSGPPSLELSQLDRHEHIHDLDHVWTDPPGDNVYGPRRFEGTTAELREEIKRLGARLKVLHDGDAAVSAIKPDKSDSSGYRLLNMLEWRRQRKSALAAEISRLEKQAARLAQAQAVWGSADVTQTGNGLDAVNGELLTWLEVNGAEVHVGLQGVGSATTPQCSSSSGNSQRTCSATEAATAAGSAPTAGVFTRKALKQNDTMAVIPVRLGYRIKPGMAKLESAVRLMMDIQDAVSATSSSSISSTAEHPSGSTVLRGGQSHAPRPFMLSLPPIGTVRSLYNFPNEYMPIIQQGRTERHIRRLQKALSSEYESFRAEIDERDNSTTYAELQHAASLIATRPLLPISGQEGGEDDLLLVPLFNNARHNSSCPHDYFLDTCGNSSSTGSGLCFFWVAGSDLPMGAEVCISFGYLRSDQALLMYGLPADASSSSSSSSTEGGSDLWLSGMDFMEATDEEPLAPVADEPLQRYEPGTRDEALSETIFLFELLQNRTDPADVANITSIAPIPSDPSGTFLAQLLAWRQQRLDAIEWELRHLSTAWNISETEIQQQLQHAREHDENGEVYRGLAQGGQNIDSNFSSNSSDPWQRMLDWMRHNGAVINVNVTYAGPQYGRVVVTNSPMKRGDLLAAIPADLMWNTTTSGGNGSMQLAAANLWAEIDNVHSPYHPYLAALPSEDELLCPLVHMPPEYLPLLASHAAEAFIEAYESQLEDFWQHHGADMTSRVPSTTFDRFKYARGLLSTRLFGLTGGAAMVPLLDLANHAPDCPNDHVETPCPHDPDRDCIVWSAGAFLPRGSEVCNTYKWMTNDKSMLQYGFLQSGPIEDVLHTVDQAETNSSNIFTVFGKMKYGPPPFNGTADETAAEISRLQASLANLTATAAAAASAKAVPEDKHGRLLSLLLMWRKQRRTALRKEIARLEQQLAVMQGNHKQQPEGSVFEQLVSWIKDNGGQVNGVRVGAADTASARMRSGVGATVKPGVFATAAITAGEVLAVVPLELALPVNTDNLLIDGPVLHTEIHQPLSPRAPYYATLPAHSDVFSFYEMPIEYAPVIQHKPTADVLLRSNRTLKEFLEDNPEQSDDRNMSLDDLKHTFSLVATRMVTFAEGGHLVPLIDQANHQNSCSHRLTVTSCNSSSSSSSNNSGGSPAGLNTTRLCAVWQAGADLTPGEEVCMSYGWLLPDRALLQYGFIPKELLPAVDQEQHGSAADAYVPLFGMDRHDFKAFANSQLPWRYRLDKVGAPELYQGNQKDTQYEITRLELILDDLTAGDAAAAAVKVSPEDSEGILLQQLRLWRQLRKMGLAQEVARLRQQHQQPQHLSDKDEL